MQQHSLAGLGLAGGGPAKGAGAGMGMGMGKGPVMPRVDPAAVQLKKTGARRSSIGGAPSELSAMQAEIAAAEAAAEREREAKEAAERAQRAADRALSAAPAPASSPVARPADQAPVRPSPTAPAPNVVVVGNTLRRGKKEEKQCGSCKKEFGLLRSKNKCVACGSYFCSKCIRKAVLSKFDKKAMEVCGNCYSQHQQR